ncbi:dTDP-glucose 4,6-dehydratase [bacterium]|nr:dTDP-glucose 4,6-dehydratase [bacterium]
MKVLVTGGAGFIGSHFIEFFLRQYSDSQIVNVDCLTYAAHPETPARLLKAGGGRYQFYKMDIGDPSVAQLIDAHQINAIVNFAAETHVDRSILDPQAFIKTNILGTQNLLQAARKSGNLRFVHVSTDEVYGSLEPGDPTFTELTSLDPNSPYAASKAGADLLALASQRTYQQDILITRCTNNYGPYQFPEKLLPLIIANAMEDKPIPVYGDGKQIRDWIYVEDHCRGIDAVLQKGKTGEVYNISSSFELTNLEIIKRTLKLLKKPESLITFVGDRPAHDRRYGLNPEKIKKELGWSPRFGLDEGLALTVEWYQNNWAWWQKVRDKEYYKYYQANYQPKSSTSSEVSS